MIYRARFFQFLFKLIWFPVFRITSRPRIYYEDKSVQKRHLKNHTMVVSNRKGTYEYLGLAFAFPFRTLHCVVSERELKNRKFYKTLLTMSGCINADRFDYDFFFIRKVDGILEKNGSVAMYPEQRASCEGEAVLDYNPAFVYLAVDTNTPIVPVYTNGSFMSREPYRMIIGKPIDVRGLYDTVIDEKTNYEYIAELIRAKTEQLQVMMEDKVSAKHRRGKR